jgi:NAD(P)H-nitrite reductase large subunit
VNLHLEQELSTVTSDAAGRVSSVSTRKGLELPCQMLGVCIGVRPGIDWLKEVATPPETGRGIKVDRAFQTSLRDVYAAGDCAEFARPDGSPMVEQIWYAAKRQGELAARAMLGDVIEYQPPLFYNSAKFFDIEYTTVGDVTRLPEDARSFFHRLPGDTASIRIIERNGAVIGFNMLGARWDHTWFERWIKERRRMDEVVEQLHLAQFDVEFGRLRLESVRAAFAEYQKLRSRQAA